MGQPSRNASPALERPPLLPCEIIVQLVQIAAPVRRKAAATILRWESIGTGPSMMLARRSHYMHGVLQGNVVVRGKVIEARQSRGVGFVIDEVKWKIQFSELPCNRLLVEQGFAGSVNAHLSFWLSSKNNVS